MTCFNIIIKFFIYIFKLLFRSRGMKLFIPFLSAIRAQEGSGGGYDEDMVRIEGCGTIFMPKAWNTPFSSMSHYKSGL